MGQVFVKMVQRESAQKRESFILGSDGKRKKIELGKSKGTNGNSIFRFTVSQHKKGYLNTGLDVKINNPWFNNEVNLPLSFKDKGIENKEEISKQLYFEIKLKLKEGELTSRISNIFEKDRKITYLQKYFKDFTETTVLNLDEPEDELTYWLLQQCHPDKCAPNKDSITSFSRLYISQVNEDEERKSKKREIVEEAIFNLFSLKKEATESQIKKLAIILKVIKGETSSEKIKNALSDFIQTKSNKQEENIKEFNKLYKLLIGNAKDKELFEDKFLLQNAINYRILSDYKGKYIWLSKKGTSLEELGKSYEEALSTISDPDWSAYREELIEEIELKK